MTQAEKIQTTTDLLRELKHAMRKNLDYEVRQCQDASGEDGTLFEYAHELFKLARQDVVDATTLKDRLYAACAAIVTTEIMLEVQAEEAGE
jgi:hypothetical protein